MAVGSLPDDRNPPAAELLQQLERVLGHPLFRSSQRLTAFLRFAVESSVGGRLDRLKEVVLGAEVFGRGAAYNPQEDPVVRVMAGRLRARLAEYYQGGGATDPIRIDLPRGGYVPRFTRLSPVPRGIAPRFNLAGPGTLVGREGDLDRLHNAYQLALEGGGSMLTISGDPGMGKTSLAEVFLASVEPEALVGRGRASERLAETDAFVPIFDTLDRLLLGTGESGVADIMRSIAPTWYVQVASELPEALVKEAKAASHDRMRREFVSFFDRLSRSRPVVMFLDDLHWADASTCDLLAYLGDRLRKMRMLVVTTYRPPELRSRKSPFLTVKLHLEFTGTCTEIPLSYLSPEDVARYIEMHFAPNRFPIRLAQAVYERTEGNPLFMTDLLRFLTDRDALAKRGGNWHLQLTLDEIRTLIPSGIRSMIGIKIGRFNAPDQDLLYCAAVQGMQFDSAALAEVLSRDPADIEERLQELDTIHNFVRMVGEQQLPQREVSVRYRFVHSFYQNVLFDSLVPSRRAALSLALATALVRLHGEKSRAIAADLAILFESGRAFDQTSHFFLEAARNAARVFAYPEAVLLCRRGLSALAGIPESTERDRRELLFSLTLGMSLMATQGYAAHEAEEAYQRSRALCLQFNDPKRLFPVLWGLHTCKIIRSELRKALDVAQEMRQIADASKDVRAIVESLHALGTTFAFMGRLVEAREALDRISETFADGPRLVGGSLFVLDPFVTSLSMLGRLLAQMGYLDQAMVKAKASVELAGRLSHPHSLAYAIFWVGWIHHARGEYGDACRAVETAMELGRDFPQILEWGRVVRGSALTRLGRVEEGIAEIRQSLERQLAMESLLERSFCYTLLAEALGAAGKNSEGLESVAAALDFAQRTDGRCYEPETHRVRGELLMALGDESEMLEAEREIKRALTLAREAQSRLHELRAAVSYLRICKRLGEGSRGRQCLEAVAGWFVEGAHSPVVRQAREALESSM